MLPLISARKDILAWYASSGRHGLPWRQTRDPYKVLVSEFMLQQTQVTRVIPKYEAFLAKFPSIGALAEASRAEVLNLWQGLGYNSRAVRLHALARLVVAEHGGFVPQDREALLALPGIGPYSAGAIRIFAHNIPSVSMDVNVRRILLRLFWPSGKNPAAEDLREAQLILLGEDAHDVQSALMDLGSAVCTANEPACKDCPLNTHCKTKGERPDEKKKKAPSRFRGSNRWWRGRIIKHLLERKRGRSALLNAIKPGASGSDKEAFDHALSQLQEEGFVTGDLDISDGR